VQDGELARRFPSGDEAVLRAAYDRFGRAVYTVAYSILRDAELAADATQATFVNAWRSAGRFDPDRELAPWIYSIARRAALDLYRRRRRVEPVDPAGFELREGAGSDETFERTWEAWQVRRAVDELPDDERLVVRLAWFDGLTHPEIAARLAVPVGTVKSRSHRAHRRLAERLGPVHDENRTGPDDVEDGERTARDGPL